MFIQTESTANADVMKYLPGRTVLEKGRVTFRDAGEAERSPLAARLFQLPGVIAVGLDHEAIIVTKSGSLEWHQLKPVILGLIMEHFTAGKPVLLDQGEGETGEDVDVEAVGRQVQELIDSRIRPALAHSGAEIVLRDFTDGVLRLSSTNAGAVAPMRTGIENIIRHYVPEVLDVRFIEHRPSHDQNIKENKAGLNSEEARMIFDLLDEHINPAVASHGGHISLVDVQGSTAYIRLEGGCQGCGMADVTLKHGVETAIKQAVPAIAAVLDTTDHAGGANPYYQPHHK